MTKKSGKGGQGPVAVYALTAQGLALAELLRSGLDQADVYAITSLRAKSPACAFEAHWFESLGPVLDANFHSYACHIFITATGIAVRAIAPHLRGKLYDPAVLVLDQQGRFVISLLSGHVGGANSMARRLAAHMGAVPIITTATDVEDLPALDQLAMERGLGIVNPEAIKTISAALLAGERIGLHDPEKRLGLAQSAWATLFIPLDRANVLAGSFPGPAVLVCATSRPDMLKGQTLLLRPSAVHAGIGCRRGEDAHNILAALEEALAQAGLSPAALVCLASIEAKQNEAGLVEAARTLGLPLRFYPPKILAGYPVSRPSAKVRQLFGIDGVCEPAALASAAEGGKARLLRGKYICKGVTVALAVRVEAL